MEVPIFRAVEKEKFEAPEYKGNERSVGGYFGYKRCPMKTDFALSSSVLSPGESVKVDLECDNLRSQYSVDTFKFKLLRKCEFRNSLSPITTTEYLQDVRIPGCPKMENVTRSHNFPIQAFE